jgi:AP2-like factor (ANT lineage)
MSNWLGFSLTPHLRIDEEFGRENQNQNQEHHGEGSEIIGRNYVPPSSSSHHQHLHNHLSVMPLRSDGSLCVSDTFTHSVTPQGIYICMFL